jgi:hypothetical protein
MSARSTALKNLPEARRWVGAALNALNAVIGFGGTRSQIAALPQFRAAQTHFHVPFGPPPSLMRKLLELLPFVEDPTVAILKVIRFAYFDIARALATPSIFRDSPAEGEGASATAFVPITRDGTIRITPFYDDVGPRNKVLVLVHESAHFLGDQFQDWAYRNRKGELDPNKYRNLAVELAITNADSYAYYALQMATGIDRVLDQEE